ncbi:MAG: alcohol dehydrogenase catalytic domain-containing protein [Spirochaetes bacterium]|nr:alcohol dehydrogenase catalytic domain-containing protein [Spirochaetota bacterium]
MKALVYSDWNTLKIKDVAEPKPESGEAVIRVEACGICGSEIESFKTSSKRRIPPLILGHEFCGTVEKIQAESSFLVPGMPVAVNSVIPCGNCNACKRGETNLCENRKVFGMNMPGGMAEYAAVPVTSLYPLPGSLDPVSGALAEPLAVSIHLLNRIPVRYVETDGSADKKCYQSKKPRAAIIGMGTIGLMILQASLVLKNAEVLVIDVQDTNLKTAGELGAIAAVNPLRTDAEKACRDFSYGDGLDFCIDAIGLSETKETALKVIRPGGSAGWFGLREDRTGISSYDVITAEKQIIGSYGAKKEDYMLAVELLSSGKVRAGNWVKIFTFNKAVEGFYSMMKGEVIKSVIMVNNSC